MFLFKRSVLALSFTCLICFVGANKSYSNSLPDAPVFVQEFIGQMDFIEGRLTLLLSAMSQDQLAWTPEEGVRTCGQIYLHVAGANHLLVNFMSGMKTEGEPRAIEKSTTDKDEIMKKLKESFEAVKEAAGKLTEEDLDKVSMTPFGFETSLRNFMVSLLSHSHEHLGQGIAYARMNHVVPPWSQKQDSN